MNAEHYCDDVDKYPADKFLQFGSGLGAKVLVVGEAPAPNGWRLSGRAFYTTEGKLLPTGRNMNELLASYGLSVENCAFTELVKCYPGDDRKLLKVCGTKCWPIFLRQVDLIKPSLIIILGVKTTEIFNLLAKADMPMGVISTARVGDLGCRVLAIYHPSPVSPTSRQRNRDIFSRLSAEGCEGALGLNFADQLNDQHDHRNE
jgi:uracil-DNA glycosylase family 4